MITAVVVLIVASPSITRHDSFPISTYPMYAFARENRAVFSTAYGLTPDGTRRSLPIEVIAGTDDPLRAGALVRDAVDQGLADQLCDRIAARAPAGVRTVVVVREEHDVVAAASGDLAPLASSEVARCSTDG